MTDSPIADVAAKTVTFGGTTYFMRPLSDDAYTVLVDGVPVGRVVYTFGTANGVTESSSVTEDTLTAIAEGWFAALDG